MGEKMKINVLYQAEFYCICSALFNDLSLWNKFLIEKPIVVHLFEKLFNFFSMRRCLVCWQWLTIKSYLEAFPKRSIFTAILIFQQPYVFSALLKSTRKKGQ